MSGCKSLCILALMLIGNGNVKCYPANAENSLIEIFMHLTTDQFVQATNKALAPVEEFFIRNEEK